MGWDRSVSAAAIAAAMVAACVWACGGSDSSGVGSGDGGATGGDGGDAGAYTLDDVCQRAGPQVCALRKPCCDQGSGYDETGCLAHEATQCAKDVAAVRAGRETFHPERVDPCLARFKDLVTGCTSSLDLLTKAVSFVHECEVFEGRLAVGASCERDSECLPSPNANEAVTCDSTKKVCQTLRVLSNGEACSFANGVSAICDQGLYCDVDFAASPPAGTCKKATPVGQACNASKPFDLECGLGNYCESSTGVCTVGKDGNASCANDLECKALSCAGPDGGKTCATPKPLVKPEECKGP